MTRVSLREAYDNKDVIAQIYAIRDTAESAVDTSEQAVTTANTASDHVDALVPQVEGAVQNANSASASAQASAQTVAGYENRLGAVEGDVVQLNTDVDGVESDLNAVTLRVTTAEGQIVTIQGRVTALETADGQNVKINAINDYAVGLTGNQDNISGEKIFTNQYRGMRGFILKSNVNQYFRMAEFDGNVGGNGSLVFIVASRGTFGMFRVNMTIDSSTHAITLGTDASNQILTVTGSIKIGIDYDANSNVYRIFYCAVTNNVSIHLDIMHATIGTGNNLNIINKTIENITPNASLAEVTV